MADVADPYLNTATLRWTQDFYRRAAALGYNVISAVSFELFDAFTWDTWKQRDLSGNPALTGYTPPTTLLSPCNLAAQSYLKGVAQSFVNISVQAGLQPLYQVGEPWWWVPYTNVPFIYDADTVARFTAERGVAPPAITDLKLSLNAPQLDYLDWCGARLAEATSGLCSWVKAVRSDTLTSALFYSPQVFRPEAPETARLNFPIGWASPAFDVFELENYQDVMDGDLATTQATVQRLNEALGYPQDRLHYYSGVVIDPADKLVQWPRIDAGAARAVAGIDPRRVDGFGEVFIWAYPQVVRDGFVHISDAPEALDVEERVLASFNIPLTPTPQRFSVSLSGTTYKLTVQWREQVWVLDIATADGAPLLSGVPLVTGADLLAQHPEAGIPGKLVVSTDLSGVLPTFDGLGTTARLYYVS